LNGKKKKKKKKEITFEISFTSEGKKSKLGDRYTSVKTWRHRMLLWQEKSPSLFPEALFQVNIKREKNEKIDFKLFKQALKGVEGIFGISTSPNFPNCLLF